MSDHYQLAQVNVAHAKDDLDSDTLSGFVNRLDEINHLADAAPGFVWRLNPRTQTDFEPGYDDPRIVVNLSVWESLDSLKIFVYRTIHLELIQQKADWFEPLKVPHLALWWVPMGTQPTEKDGIERLDYLREHGPSQRAFSISKPYPPS